MFCLFDLWVRISWLSSLEKNDASVIAYQGSHSPALSEWALLMAFSKEESISGLPLEDNNTPISSALMLSKLPWFFPPTSFKSTLREWHEQEGLLSLNPHHIERLQGSSIIHAGRRRTDWIVTTPASTDGENERGMSCSPFSQRPDQEYKGRD